MPLSSSFKSSKAKKRSHVLTNEDKASNARVEKIIQDNKARSKARLEAKQKKKKLEQEAEAKKARMLELRHTKRDLQKLNKVTQDDMECQKICDYFEKNNNSPDDDKRVGPRDLESDFSKERHTDVDLTQKDDSTSSEELNFDNEQDDIDMEWPFLHYYSFWSE